MTFADAREIDQLIKVANSPHATAIRLETGFGIPDADDQVWFVLGIDGPATTQLGLPAMLDGVAYRQDTHERALTLRVPLVRDTGDGFVSDAASPFPLRVIGGVQADGPLATLARIPPDTLIVNGATFGKIIATSTGLAWDEVRRSYDAGTLEGWPLVRSVFVWVSDLNEVRGLADQLESEGWSTSYTLRAFKDVEDNLIRTRLVGGGVALVISAGAVVLGLLSLNTWLRLARRDMGLLRHMGYSVTDVCSMYRRRVSMVVWPVAAVIAVLAAVTGLAFLPDRPLYVMGDIALVLALGAMVYFVATRVMLPRAVGQPILQLLKLYREFE